jgi:DNA-binding NtrC family response regulator
MNLLVLGDSATGRERVVRTFHAGSRLRQGPFVTLHASADADRFTRSLLSRFGSSTPIGFDDVFRASEGGCLFVDEIEGLSQATQRLFLEFLRSGRSLDAGDSGWSGRLAAGSENDLEALCRSGRFHAPLFDALDKIRLDLSPTC